MTIDIYKLDAFTDAYIECALWSTHDENGEPLDDTYGPEDIDAATLAEMVADCASFQEDNADILETASELYGLTDEEAGHDFWLDREGHGAGSWDRGMRDTGDKLTDAAKVYGGFYLGTYNGKVVS